MGRNGAGGRPYGGDDVRCYCNQPACVTLGYMCRAPPGGGCYSELPARELDFSAATHGCLHHIADGSDGEFIQRCQNSPGSSGFGGSISGGKQNSLLLCCFTDLCNHVDSPNTKLRLNDSVAGALGNGSEGNNDENGAINSAALPAPGYANGEVWFKAATIAVPICGFLILFMLVALAIRLLKSDSLDSASNKLSSTYVPHSPSHSQNSIVVKKPLGHGAAAPLLMSRTVMNDDNKNTIIQTYCLNNEVKTKFPLINAIANNTMSGGHVDQDCLKNGSNHEKIINMDLKCTLKDINVNLALIDESSQGQLPEKLYIKESLVTDDRIMFPYTNENLR